MKEIDSDRIKSAFALLSLEDNNQNELENLIKFTPAVTYKRIEADTGENVSVIFIQAASFGEFFE